MKSCCKDTFEGSELPDHRPTDERPQGWLSRLRSKWQVRNVLQVILILCTFAIGGSACGYIGKRLIALLHIDNRAIWLLVYILLVTLLWPLCVLVISIPFGQFGFFRKYLAKMGRRMSGRK